MSAETRIFPTPKTEHGVPHSMHSLLSTEPSFGPEGISVVAKDFFPIVYNGPTDTDVHARWHPATANLKTAFGRLAQLWYACCPVASHGLINDCVKIRKLLCDSKGDGSFRVV